MTEFGPYSNYRLTVRLALPNQPGTFARVAMLLAEEGANLGAVDIVSASAETIVRDITFDAHSDSHGERVIQALGSLPGVRVVSFSDRIFVMHLGGKIQIESKVPVTTRNALSMVYTPGVGRVAQSIARDPMAAYASRQRATASRSSRMGPRCWGWDVWVRKGRCRSWKARRCSSRNSRGLMPGLSV